MLSINTIAAKIFGTSNDRKIKAYRPMVEAINALEDEVKALSDDDLRARTVEFREHFAHGMPLKDLLAPAFATVREGARRALGQRHFDVQLIGGMVLNGGDIAEMKTGEGKTLVATLAVYLNALTDKGVHVVTVNDYLANRDAEWMGTVYKFLGLSVGCIVHGLDDDERRAAYACDVTYATNNELGFDYLRDNMKMRAPEMVQRGHAYGIVDEVDSILIDEARTPLIISGPVEDRADLYMAVDELMKILVAEHDQIEKQLTAAHPKEELKELLKTKGMMEIDESPEQAARREAFEETGVTVDLRGILAVLAGPQFRVTYPNGDEVAYVSTVFDAVVTGGEPRPDGEETSAVAWFTLGELARPDTDGFTQALLAAVIPPGGIEPPLRA